MRCASVGRKDAEGVGRRRQGRNVEFSGCRQATEAKQVGTHTTRRVLDAADDVGPLGFELCSVLLMGFFFAIFQTGALVIL